MVNKKTNPRRTKSRTGGSYLRKKIEKRRKKQTVRPPLKGYLRTGGFYDRGQELKFYDTTFADETIENVGAIIRTAETTDGNFLKIAQGTGQSQRIGKKIVLKSVSARIRFDVGRKEEAAFDSSSAFVLRMVCVLDTQTNGSFPTWIDIFAADRWDAPVNLANSERFRIIKEWLVDFNKMTLSLDGAGTMFIQDGLIHTDKWNTKLDIPMEYSSTTGAIAEIKSNNIYFFGITGGNNASPTVNGWVRWRYDDS